MKNVVVIGAGSAGWLTALFIQAQFPQSNITVIGSTEIGIIGAGEGTVPLINGFLEAINLSAEDILRNCKGTQKLGIRFINWANKKTFNNVNNREYFHGFKLSPIGSNLVCDDPLMDLGEAIDVLSVTKNKNISQYSLEDILALEKLVGISNESIINDQKLFGHSLHFDANLLAEYLKSVGVQRGIKYVDDIVEDFSQKENGDVQNIICRNTSIDCDFIFDCSGFRRLVIGKLYKTKWIDFQERLPVKTAIPFFLPPEEKYENYTTATALDYGWCWKIPLQHRSGCGYVFDSDFCDEETAARELIEKFGKVDIIRSIKFNAGFYEKSWVNNCICVGLSSGFVEPLEATSLMVTMVTLYEALKVLSPKPNESSTIDDFNDYCEYLWNDVADFIQYHYLNGRDDTEFWKRINCAKRSDNLESTLDAFKTKTPYMKPNYSEKYAPIFSDYSWFRVGLGINHFSKELLNERASKIKNQFLLEESQKRVLSLKNKFSSHEDYLIKIVGHDTLLKNRKLIFK